MAFITIAGEQLIAQKQGDEEILDITHFVLAYIDGLGAEPSNRIEAMPSLDDIVDTRPVTSQGYINANQVVYSLALDSTIGTYTFNWVGLKAAGGELVAAAHIEPQIKTATNGAVPGNNLTRNFLIAYSGIQATTAIAVPAETWQIDFTTRLLQIDTNERLSNYDVYGVAAFFVNYFQVVFVSGSTYRITNGFGYVGGIRCYIPADVDITVTPAPKFVWIDVSQQGDINGVYQVVAFTATASELVNYVDSNGFTHYVAKLANIPSAGVVTDLRLIAPVFLRRDEIVPQAEAQAGTATTARAWTAQRVKQAIDSLSPTVPAASETVQGKIELATSAEVLAGADAVRAVTPAGLAAENTRARIIAKLGFEPVQQGNGVGQVGNLVKIGWSAGSRLKATVDVSDLGNFVFDDVLNAAIAALSADIMAWAQLGFEILAASPGYIQFPTYMGRLIIQWGSTNLNAGVYTLNAALPKPFSTAFFSGVVTDAGGNAVSGGVSGNGLNGITIAKNPAYTGFVGYRWIIIGQ